MHIHWHKALQIFRALNFNRSTVWAVLAGYLLVTAVTAAIEGVGLVTLVGIFTGGLREDGTGKMPEVVTRLLATFGVEIKLTAVLPFLLGAFVLLFIMRFCLLLCDGAMNALVRRRLQTEVFRRYLFGDWAHMRDFRVGEAIGTNTQEALVVTKYLTSAVLAAYYALTALIMGVLAVAVDWKIALVLGLLGLPLVFLMRWVFAIQAKWSKELAEVRIRFSGDIAERLNGLLQVHVDGNPDYHLRQGVVAQGPLTRLELLIAACGAVIGSFNIILPLTMLIGLSLWLAATGSTIEPYLGLIASVGVLGVRVASQLNGAVAALGNLSRLSGSLHPVLEALSVPPMPARQLVDEPVVGIELAHLAYAYGKHQVLGDICLTAETGTPIVLRGRSGSGKTTLTNLVAGVYLPMAGRVNYIGTSGTAYDSRQYRAKVGYVTQDVHFFRGSIRENLSAGRPCTDEQIWSVLEQVDAAEFVRRMGGLDAQSAEAGRSLSGGQRRRLGIARVLLAGSDILILDEITAGLDQSNRGKIVGLVERLVKHHTVILVSHEALPIDSARDYVLGSSAPALPLALGL